MAGLVGLGFTSPAVAVMVIDRTQFRVHFYQNKPDELHAFLSAKDDKLAVVLLSSVYDLIRVSDVAGVHAFLLCEDPEIISSIPGAKLLDAELDPAFPGYKKVMIAPSTLNSALLFPGSFQLDSDMVRKTMSSMKEDISLRELVSVITSEVKSLGDDFIGYVCSYAAGLIPKKTWVSKVQKPALSAGLGVDKLAELEKFIETSPSAELLWRAYYDHVERLVPVKDVVSQYEANEKDLLFLVEKLGSDPGKTYSRNPQDKPLVLKKRRKVRKLVETPVQGASISNASSSDPSKFDLAKALAELDSHFKGPEFSRVVCAYACGLLTREAYLRERSVAVQAGANKTSLKALEAFFHSPEREALVKAFKEYSCVPGLTPEEAAQACGADVRQLLASVRYKPISIVFEYPES